MQLVSPQLWGKTPRRASQVGAQRNLELVRNCTSSYDTVPSGPNQQGRGRRRLSRNQGVRARYYAPGLRDYPPGLRGAARPASFALCEPHRRVQAADTIVQSTARARSRICVWHQMSRATTLANCLLNVRAIEERIRSRTARTSFALCPARVKAFRCRTVCL